MTDQLSRNTKYSNTVGVININSEDETNREIESDYCINRSSPSQSTLISTSHSYCAKDQSHNKTSLVQEEAESANNTQVKTPPIPTGLIRNLMASFECLDNNGTESEKLMSKEKANLTPNGVENFPEARVTRSCSECPSSELNFDTVHCQEQESPACPVPSQITIPLFELHESLQLNISQYVVNRCSCYSVIHDVNKEIQSMANHDKPTKKEKQTDNDCPLIQAITGCLKQRNSGSFGSGENELAMLDEEIFLLSAIAGRSSIETSNVSVCPLSFAEAIGEVEPGYIQNNSRTQLWKPSRSWWEAKSGKNPWIEPECHNKRWRYLWPLIHYHKFLAKCVKKLKRNNIDVKKSISPVSAFLREEVCAVSEHLGNVSKFSAEEWVERLGHFEDWANQTHAEETQLFILIKQLPLRKISEQTDLESALLRSQIDESFLKALAAEKEQFISGTMQHNAQGEKDEKEQCSFLKTNERQQFSVKDPHRSQKTFKNSKYNSRKSSKVGGKNSGGQNHAHYERNMYRVEPFSGDFPTVFEGNTCYNDSIYDYHGQMMMNPQPHMQPMYAAPQYDSQFFQAVHYIDPPFYMTDNSNLQQCAYGSHEMPLHPNVHINHEAQEPAVEENQCNNYHNEMVDTENMVQTPFKQDTNTMPSSPYWGHLNLTSLSMMGLASPVHEQIAPSTPCSDRLDYNGGQDHEHSTEEEMRVMPCEPKPMFIHSNTHYNNQFQAGNVVVPPSPATQFLMPSQSNSQIHAVYYAKENSDKCYSPSLSKTPQKGIEDDVDSGQETTSVTAASSNASISDRAEGEILSFNDGQ